ncbi:unnamed protein product [Knipowitschia caucasica]
MWEQEEFAKHWKNEFPDCEVPQMDLKSVDDIETELDSCKSNMKRLQKALAEEKFKMIYLQTTVARQKREYADRFDDKDDNFNADKYSFLKQKETVKSDLRDNEVDRSRLPEFVGSFSRDRPRISGRTGKPVPIPVPPRVSSFHKPTTVLLNDNEDASDREYEDTELNDNFVRNNLLAPKILHRDKQRTSSAHWDATRPHRRSRDLDSGDDGRLSPSCMLIQRRPSRGSGCSTPDRRSDGYLSSDHEDSSSAGE